MVSLYSAKPTLRQDNFIYFGGPIEPLARIVLLLVKWESTSPFIRDEAFRDIMFMLGRRRLLQHAGEIGLVDSELKGKGLSYITKGDFTYSIEKANQMVQNKFV